MDQFTRCDYNNYLVALDNFVSKLPQFVGSLSNLVSQVVTGYSEEDTAIYLTYTNLKTAFDDKNYSLFGQYIQLFGSELIKYVAPDVVQDVTFTS